MRIQYSPSWLHWTIFDLFFLVMECMEIVEFSVAHQDGLFVNWV